jgi:hypothetical protein
MKHWEIIADNPQEGRLKFGLVSAVDSQRRTIWIVDAHRGDGRRFVVLADKKLSAFLELEAAASGVQGFKPTSDAIGGGVDESDEAPV